MMILLAYLAGAATLPLLGLMAHFVLWALSRTSGTGDCLVCSHSPTMELGRHRNITVKAASLWHTLFWSCRPWHRRALAVHEWNPRRVEQP